MRISEAIFKMSNALTVNSKPTNQIQEKDRENQLRVSLMKGHLLQKLDAFQEFNNQNFTEAPPQITNAETGNTHVTQEWPDGRKYEGQMKEGKAHGQGKMTYGDGATYEGEWSVDTWHGKGIFTKKTGQVINAIFENSKLKQRL